MIIAVIISVDRIQFAVISFSKDTSIISIPINSIRNTISTLYAASVDLFFSSRSNDKLKLEAISALPFHLLNSYQ